MTSSFFYYVFSPYIIIFYASLYLLRATERRGVHNKILFFFFSINIPATTRANSFSLFFFFFFFFLFFLFYPSLFSLPIFFLLFFTFLLFFWLKKAFLLWQRFCLRPAWGNIWFPYFSLTLGHPCNATHVDWHFPQPSYTSRRKITAATAPSLVGNRCGYATIRAVGK